MIALLIIVLAIILIVAVVIIVKKNKKPMTLEEYIAFTDGLIKDGALLLCLKEWNIQMFKKESGYPTAMSDEQMKEHLSDLFEKGKITEEEFKECYEMYVETTADQTSKKIQPEETPEEEDPFAGIDLDEE